MPLLGSLWLMDLRFGSRLGVLGPRSGFRRLGGLSSFAPSLGAAFLGFALALSGLSGFLGRLCAFLRGR